MVRTTWAIGAATLVLGIGGAARADWTERDSQTGTMRAAEAARSLAAREATNSRPSLDVSVTGREIGGDRARVGDAKREFHNKAELSAHLTTSVKIRTQGEAPASPEADGHPTVAREPKTSTAMRPAVTTRGRAEDPSLANASMDEELLLRHTRQTMRPERPQTVREHAIESQGVTGRTLGEDRAKAGDQYRDPINSARAKALAAMYPNAGRPVDDYTLLTNEQRAELARRGLVSRSNRPLSSDIEDKTR
jgi:hypothetical protein